MTESAEIYSFSDIADQEWSDEQILDFLKEVWGYDKTNELIVCGQVTKISTEYSSFWVIESFYHIDTMERLLYPIRANKNTKQTIFVGTHINGQRVHLLNKEWIKAAVDLAPYSERERHNNPFELAATDISPLKELPEPIEIEVFGKNATRLIEEQWYNLLYKKSKKRIEDVLEDKKTQISQKREELANMLNQLTQTQNTILESDKQISEYRHTIDNLKQQRLTLSNDLEAYKQEVFGKMKQLSQFVEQQARFLKTLDLIDEDTYQQFIGDALATPDSNTDTYSFSSNFNNLNEAIAFIQAHLYQKGIIYSRKTLEDFFLHLSIRMI